MQGARGLLISITGGSDLTLYEVDEAASRIREEVDPEANIILGATFDESLGGIVRVSVVATGIDARRCWPERRASSPAAHRRRSRTPARRAARRASCTSQPRPEPRIRRRSGRPRRSGRSSRPRSLTFEAPVPHDAIVLTPTQPKQAGREGRPRPVARAARRRSPPARPRRRARGSGQPSRAAMPRVDELADAGADQFAPAAPPSRHPPRGARRMPDVERLSRQVGAARVRAKAGTRRGAAATRREPRAGRAEDAQRHWPCRNGHDGARPRATGSAPPRPPSTGSTGDQPPCARQAELISRHEAHPMCKRKQPCRCFSIAAQVASRRSKKALFTRSRAVPVTQ